MKETVLLLACGAIAHELVQLQTLNQWRHVRLQCLPAELHNTPKAIPAAVQAAIETHREHYEHLFVAYADCGTGGALDRVLEPLGIERLPGAHCYEFFAGAAAFKTLSDEEPGTFYLTDFLARHFDRLVRRGLGLDRHPELRDAYFGNYRRLVYLAQSRRDEFEPLARSHAEFLGLAFHTHETGLAPLNLVMREQAGSWPS